MTDTQVHILKLFITAVVFILWCLILMLVVGTEVHDEIMIPPTYDGSRNEKEVENVQHHRSNSSNDILHQSRNVVER